MNLITLITNHTVLLAVIIIICVGLYEWWSRLQKKKQAHSKEMVKGGEENGVETKE